MYLTHNDVASYKKRMPSVLLLPDPILVVIGVGTRQEQAKAFYGLATLGLPYRNHSCGSYRCGDLFTKQRCYKCAVGFDVAVAAGTGDETE